MSSHDLTRALVGAALTAVVSDEAVAAVPPLLEDHVASALPGAGRAPVVALLDATSDENGRGRVIGHPDQTRAPGTAALLGGFAAHLLDLDDASEPMRGHPSAVLFPTLAALAGPDTAGRQIAEAYVVGLETLSRLGRALGPGPYARGFHYTGLLGGIGGAVAGARLLGLWPEKAVRAVGLATQQAGGLRASFGSQAKPLLAGLAARSAVEAVNWARLGLTAADDGLGGAAGLLHAVSGAAVSGVLLEPWNRWSILEHGVWLKQGPFCSAAISAVDAAVRSGRDLASDAASRSADLQRPGCRVLVEVRPGATDALVVDLPSNGEEGRFSLRYLVALGLLGLPFDLSTLGSGDPDPRALALARIVETRVVPAAASSAADGARRDRWARVTVRDDERELAGAVVTVPSGSPGAPPRAEQRRAKLRSAVGSDAEAAGLSADLARMADLPWSDTAERIAVLEAR